MPNKIEQIVRFYVKKLLVEAVVDLDKLIESRVNQKVELAFLLKEGNKKRTLREVTEVEEEAPAPRPVSQRKKLSAADLGITEDMWKSVYEDTLNSDNPILESSGDDASEEFGDKPELVPERMLEAAGLMRDYSAHVEAFTTKDRSRKGDAELELRRKEILKKVIQ
jgi:hypothetical protein